MSSPNRASRTCRRDWRGRRSLEAARLWNELSDDNLGSEINQSNNAYCTIPIGLSERSFGMDRPLLMLGLWDLTAPLPEANCFSNEPTSVEPKSKKGGVFEFNMERAKSDRSSLSSSRSDFELGVVWKSLLDVPYGLQNKYGINNAWWRLILALWLKKVIS